MLNTLLGTLSEGAPPPSLTSYESISTVTVGSAVSSITFSSIPATYAHLQLRGILRSTRNSGEDGLRITINSDTNAANYNAHYLRGDGSSAQAGEVNTGVAWAGLQPTDTSTLVFSGETIDILDYANTNKAKTIRHLGGYDYNGGGWINFTSTLWTSTAAITSLVFTFDSTSNFTQYSQLALYGIKGA